MSVLSVLHVPSTLPRIRLTGLRTALRRIADGAVDSPVLHATSAPERPRPHAHWHPVTGPDGRTRLEASWHIRH